MTIGRLTTNGWLIALLVVVAFVVVWTCALGHARVRRLHRLHQRLDAGRAGLELALARRTEVAALAGVRVARPPAHQPPDQPGSDRETAANALGRRLAALDRAPIPPSLRAELDEAEELLRLARHVHNEAVRDTLVLRSRRLVRLLRLAGTAPMPSYFETVDPGRSPWPAPAGATGWEKGLGERV